MNEELPSIKDFIEDISQLPSINEEVESELPSVEDYIEKEEEVLIEEEIEDCIEEEVLTEEEVESELPSDEDSVEQEEIIEEETDTETIVSEIESIRDSIPEDKLYDKELYELVHLIEDLRKDIPEVKYYDEQISELEETIQEVKDRNIPDFKWIGYTFSAIDENYDSLSTSLATLKDRLDLEVSEIVESIETSNSEKGADVKRLDESISTTKEEIIENISETKEEIDKNIFETKEEISKKIFETKEKIWKELKETSLRIWNLNKEHKKDSTELRKETKLLYKELGQHFESIKNSNSKIDKLNEYFEYLIDEVNQLPEVKYYDDQIDKVTESVKSVQNLVEVLENKLNRKIKGLKESILVVPPSTDNEDPLTPLDQNFATLDDLSSHYRLFLNRIQQQLASLGGGGETRLEFLDDVDRNSAKVDGKFLKYQASTGKWVGADGGGGSGGIAGVGIQSGSTRIGLGFTDLNFTGEGISSVVGSGDTVTIDVSSNSTTIRRQVETASGITTDFTINSGYTVGFIDVFLNGVKQRSGTDFTATSGTSVTMIPFVNDGDVLEFQVYENLSVSNNTTRDEIQGYYGYTTDYYTVGVANTVQTIGAGVTTLIEPQVAAVYQHLPTIMTGVGTNPYIGNTATTIGTGQTEFSLAGLSSGASCIVRTALAFDPDEDNTTLDVQLKFTTNTATQGTGLTNFTILKENALIMQVGGDQQYISENIFSFFVGTTLEGTTYDNAGSFSIEVIPSNDGDLEVLAVTVNVVA